MTIDEESMLPKKRGQYSTKRKRELETLLTAVKDFKVSKTKNENFKKNPASIAEFTKDTCLYPAKYLDNDNTCIKCDIYEHCGCKLKTLGKKRKNE